VALILLLLLLLLGGFGLSMHRATSGLESTTVDKVMAAAELNGVHGAGALAGARLFAESPGSSMPQFGALGAANLENVALFLAASRGGP
jgi:hypothetical protein